MKWRWGELDNAGMMVPSSQGSPPEKQTRLARHLSWSPHHQRGVISERKNYLATASGSLDLDILSFSFV